MFRLAVIVIAIALLPLAFAVALAVAIPLIFVFVAGVIILVLAHDVMQDPMLGIGMVVVVVLSLVRVKFEQALGRLFNKKLWYHDEG